MMKRGDILQGKFQGGIAILYKEIREQNKGWYSKIAEPVLGGKYRHLNNTHFRLDLGKSNYEKIE